MGADTPKCPGGGRTTLPRPGPDPRNPNPENPERTNFPGGKPTRQSEQPKGETGKKNTQVKVPWWYNAARPGPATCQTDRTASAISKPKQSSAPSRGSYSTAPHDVGIASPGSCAPSVQTRSGASAGPTFTSLGTAQSRNVSHQPRARRISGVRRVAPGCLPRLPMMDACQAAAASEDLRARKV